MRYPENYILGFLLISVKEGIHQYGDRAVDALLKEFTQLNGMDIFLGTDPKKLVRIQKKKVFKALLMITEKRNESLKGRTCADGCK